MDHPEQLTLFDTLTEFRIEASMLHPAEGPKTFLSMRLPSGTEMDQVRTTVHNVAEMLGKVGADFDTHLNAGGRMYGTLGTDRVVIEIKSDTVYTADGKVLGE